MVGNLGAYQIMTMLAKRVGGPVVLGGIVALAGGTGGGIAVYKGRNQIERAMQCIKEKLGFTSGVSGLQKEDRTYTCNADCELSKELTLKQNNKFNVLYSDDEMALINVIGDDNSPYIVGREKLESVSDFEG
jgi:hypothetical protein